MAREERRKPRKPSLCHCARDQAWQEWHEAGIPTNHSVLTKSTRRLGVAIAVRAEVLASTCFCGQVSRGRQACPAQICTQEESTLLAELGTSMHVGLCEIESKF